MTLKKLSLTDEEIELAKELLSKKIKVRVIAARIGVHRTTIWRNFEILGINKKLNKNNKDLGKDDCFSWEKFNNSVI